MKSKNILLRTQVLLGYLNPLQPLVDSLQDCIRGTGHRHRHTELKNNFHWLLRHPFRALRASWNKAGGFKKGALIAGSPLAVLGWGTKVISNAKDKASDAITNVMHDMIHGFKNRKSNNVEMLGVLSAFAAYAAGTAGIAITAATGVGLPVAMSIAMLAATTTVASLMTTGLVQESFERYQTFKRNEEGPAIQCLFEQYGIWSDQEDIGYKLSAEL